MAQAREANPFRATSELRRSTAYGASDAAPSHDSWPGALGVVGSGTHRGRGAARPSEHARGHPGAGARRRGGEARRDEAAVSDLSYKW